MSRSSFLSPPTPVTLFFVLLIALMPVGGLLVYSTLQEIDHAADIRKGEAAGRMLAGARAAESLIARNALALRVAANGALLSGNSDPCATAGEALQIAPALARDFTITNIDGTELCGEERELPSEAAVRPGDMRMWIAPDQSGIIIRVGVADGSATSVIGRSELADAVHDVSPDIKDMRIGDGTRDLYLFDDAGAQNTSPVERRTLAIAGGRLEAAAVMPVQARDKQAERKLILLPALMWFLAAAIAWILVERMLTRPIRLLRRAVGNYDPDGDDFKLPPLKGAAREVRDLGDSFAATFGRIEESEDQLVAALDGQRRLVREVHHRVKNNLQVVASLLNIHSRNAEGEEAQQAYAGIGRRVEALAVVHRNHFAEVEESRGIQLRPLITELGSSLRASSTSGHAAAIQLDLDTASTTQDTAVAAAFLITEIVEYIMIHSPHAAIEIGLRRTSELTARLSISSDALADRSAVTDDERTQFDRVVDGLARQLRSHLDRKVGSYGVEIPIFPEN